MCMSMGMCMCTIKTMGMCMCTIKTMGMCMCMCMCVCACACTSSPSSCGRTTRCSLIESIDSCSTCCGLWFSRLAEGCGREHAEGWLAVSGVAGAVAARRG